MRLSYCVLALALCVALVSSADPGVTSYNLNGAHAYDIFWVVNTATGFLLTNDATGLHKLWKTTNYGVNWQTQTLVDPTRQCYVVRIYSDPMNPQNFIFMGPPELKCGWNTNDGGNTLTYITIPGVQYISFNPGMSGYGLGTTLDSKVYFTRDYGTTWNQIGNVTRAAWAPRPVAVGSTSQEDMYVIRDSMLCYTSDYGATFTHIFDDMVELRTTSNFVYAVALNRTLVVGQNLNSFSTAYFPFGDTVPYVYSVSDDSSGATWLSTDASAYWGNIYTAGTSGALYVEKRQHVLKRDDASLDIHSVHGLPGVHLANVVVNFNDHHDLQLKTYITFNNGGDWSALQVPSGQYCATCNLHLYFNYKTDLRAFFTSSNMVGLLIANGYVATSMSYDNPFGLAPFISRDAGLTWQQLNTPISGPHIFEFGQNGAILVLAPENQQTQTIYYSLDQGQNFNSINLPQSVYVTRISTPTNASSVFAVFASTVPAAGAGSGSGFVYGINFAPLNLAACTPGDYENWWPSDNIYQNCLLGQMISISRRSRDSKCNDTRGQIITVTQNCSCTIEDYECDFGFAGDNGTCTVTGNLPPSPPTVCIGTYEKSQGFRIVPGDKCVGGLDKRPQVVDCPKPDSNSGSSSKAWVVIVVILVVIIVVGLLGFIIYRDPSMKAKVLALFGRSSNSRYSRVGRGGRSSSLAHEEDFGIHDDLLDEEDDAKVLHDNDITRASASKSPSTTSDVVIE